MIKRLEPGKCCGILIDVQEFFLAQLDPGLRDQIEIQTASFVQLLRYLQIPVLVTLENPLAAKGLLPSKIDSHLNDYKHATTLQKNYFDLTHETSILNYLRSTGKTQMLIAGCETDVCVMQSCLGLLDMGFDVFVTEDLLFSSSKEIASAVARMKAGGAIFLTYKSLYHELLKSVAGSPFRLETAEAFGPFPRELAEFPFN